jgi:hypothetical protein
VRYATLAANSHNTQPWRFTIEQRRIVIAPDFSRRCPVVDPDDHHLYVSLGCAAENLVHAAAAIGLKASPAFEADAVAVHLEPGPSTRSPLPEAIPRRQCTGAAYDGRPVAAETLRLLERAGTADGVSVLLITDRAKIGSVIDYALGEISLEEFGTSFPHVDSRRQRAGGIRRRTKSPHTAARMGGALHLVTGLSGRCEAEGDKQEGGTIHPCVDDDAN